jgi:hypothetical protein
LILRRFVFASLAALTLSVSLGAQELTASVTDPTNLPDAPRPQLPAYAAASTSVDFESFGQSSSQQQNAAPQQTPAEPQQPETAEQRKARSDKQIQEEEHQRIAGVLPAFNSVQADKALPLTPRQKFHLFFRGSIDPYQFAIAAADAGIEEAEDEYSEYHWGVSGLARRFGASYADSFDGNFWGNAVLPSLLHQDPRYYRLGRASGKSGWHRFFYAASTTIICHGDNGKLQPNYSNVAGNFIGGAISNIYYPASDRGVGLTISRGFTTTAEGIVGAELIEFYPDFVSWRQHRRERKLAAHTATSASASDGAQKAQDVAPPATTPAP